jgi:hypothetical protein
MNRRDFFKKNLITVASLGMGLVPLDGRAQNARIDPESIPDATLIPE